MLDHATTVTYTVQQDQALKNNRMIDLQRLCLSCTLVLQVHTPVFYAVAPLDDAPKVSLI